MTRQAQKYRERFLVEEAARRLGRDWTLGSDREHPDFIITEGAHQFGLEVCEVFTGAQGRGGSVMKKSESDTQKLIQALRREYEAVTNIPLIVKLVGDMSADNLAAVVPSLHSEDLASKPVGHHVVIDAENGLRVQVTKSYRPEWYSVNDRVGFVDRFAATRIADAVNNKATELPRYQAAAGLDIRLLVVADRFNNSGKLTLEERTILDRRGFSTVYFYSYPEAVIVFDGS